MDESSKFRLVMAIEDLIEAIPPLLGAVTEQEAADIIVRLLGTPKGLGTDGTLWSVAEHRDYLKAVCRRIENCM